MTLIRQPLIATVLFCVGMSLPIPAQSRINISALIALAEDPHRLAITLPFEYQRDLGASPGSDSPQILTLSPVVPLRLREGIDLFATALIPASVTPGRGAEGHRIDLEDTEITLIFSPSRHGGLLWGAGPIVKLPTAAIPRPTTDRWGLGPAFILLHVERGDPWVYGIGVENLWSLGPGHGRRDHRITIFPILSYRLSENLFLTSSPEIAADWGRPPDQRWNVPIGGGIGTRIHLGRTRLNLTIAAYYNAIRPDFQSEWTLALQLGFTLFE